MNIKNLALAVGLAAAAPLVYGFRAANAEPPADLGRAPLPASPPGKKTPGPEATEPAAVADRAELLTRLYAELKKAPDAATSAPIAASIEKLWAFNSSDTVSLLMSRAQDALIKGRVDLSLDLLDAVTELAPDYADGFSARAMVLLKKSNFERGLGDLRRALALEPKHFRAILTLANILGAIGQKKAALAAYEQIRAIYPYAPGLKDTMEELSREVEGQKI